MPPCGLTATGRSTSKAAGRGHRFTTAANASWSAWRQSLVITSTSTAGQSTTVAEWNRLQGERRLEAGQRDRKLADVKRKLAGIVDAIERGIITPTTKERLEALEAEKATLEQVVVEPALPVIHPNLAEHYRSKVAQLQAELVDPEMAAAAESMRHAMIKTIKVTPCDKRGCVCLELHGELATILAITADRQNGNGPRRSRIQASVVAGARYSYCSTGRVCGLKCDCLDLVFGASRSKLLNSPPKINSAISTIWIVIPPIIRVCRAIPRPKFPATRRQGRSANARFASIQSHVLCQHREVAPTAV
jgi:hypothetical protein